MVRIKDIARRAGVSLSAVSIALNGKKGLGIETRERILNIAHEMNYQQLHKKKSHGTIRFLKIALHGNTINDDHNLFINGYIDGMIEMASQSGFSLEVVNYEFMAIEEIISIQNQSHPVDGFIILGTEFEKKDFYPLRYLKKPFVIIDNVNDFLPYDFVNMNNRGAVYKVLEHFQHNGLYNIGLIYSNVHTPNFHQREMAFYELVSSLGLTYMQQNIICVNSSTKATYQKIYNFLRSEPLLPDGFFCVNDTIAYGCIKALQEFRCRVPDDISVIGFDDLPISGVMEPALTTIQVSRERMGMAATKLLIEKLQIIGHEASHKSILISGVLMKRSSVLENIKKQ